MLPSIPKVFKQGLTKYTDDDPVTPKTQKRTCRREKGGNSRNDVRKYRLYCDWCQRYSLPAASVLLSFQLGLCFVVHVQKEEELEGEELEKTLLPVIPSVLFLITFSNVDIFPFFPYSCALVVACCRAAAALLSQ